MNEISFDKEIEIAIKAAKSAGNFLNEDKNNLNLKIKSNPKDTKLMADIKSEKLILDILNLILSEYSAKNSISLIIDKKNIIIGKSELDVTNQIMELLNKKIKKVDLK